MNHNVKNKIHTVLVTGSGTVVGQGLIKCLKLANLKNTIPQYFIIACDMNENAAGQYRTNRSVIVPSPLSSNYIQKIINICKKYSIGAIMIGTEEEAETLAKNSKKIKKESGAIVVTNPSKVLKITNDKWETFLFLKKNHFKCANSSLPTNQNKFIEKQGFPIVVKPREGHGSLGFFVVNNLDELNNAKNEIKKLGWNPMLQEYLDEDKEYTIGVMIDSSGKEVLSSIPMKKDLKCGQTYKAFIEKKPKILKISQQIALAIGATGPINIQGKIHKKEFKIFEINPRFSSTLPIRAAAGINEADISFKDFCLNKKEKHHKFEELICLRYLNEVFIPYSDRKKLKKETHLEKSKSFVLDYF